MSPSNLSHLLFTALPAWGHNRPICALSARLVRERDNMVVTIFTVPTLLDKFRSELSRQFQGNALQPLLQRIRVVAIFESAGESELFKLLKPFMESYPAAYMTLSQAKPITCSETKVTFDAAPAPAAVILDFFAFPQLLATRTVTGNSVPIIAWATGGTSTTIRLWGPESLGGLGDFGAKTDAEAVRTGVSPEEVGDKILKHTEGAVVKIPGLPAMYDYEFFPQIIPFDIPLAPFLRGGYNFLQTCDAVIMATSEAFEKESLDAMRSWLLADKKDVYALGPLLPVDYGSEAETGLKDTEVAKFLNRMNTDFGTRSVLFMSFGTVFWPTVHDYIDEVIEALLEKKFPFIFCCASPFAKIPEELTTKVKVSGLGMLTTWAPQQYILNHPAIGWFLTHGGHGSLTESLASGIPLIFWPFDADQPAAAAHLSENLKAGIELIEVRTGQGVKPLLRNGKAPVGTREAVGVEIREVIDAIRGQKGVELRGNAEKLKEEFSKAWKEGGTAVRDLTAFLEKYVQ